MFHRRKIVFITNFIPPYRVTFFEKLCLNSEYEWLVVHGVKETEDGRPVYQGELKFPNTSVKYIETRVGSFDIRWQKGIVSVLQEWKPDIVITVGIPSILSNWLAMNWAHRHSAKILTWHSGWEKQARSPKSLHIKRWISKRYLALVDHTLVYSTKGEAYLMELIDGDSKNITVCYNGLDIDPILEKESDFRVKGQLLHHQQQTGEGKIFLYVGGMLEEKNVSLLIKAFAQLTGKENAVLWLVGDGPDMPKFKKLVETLNMKNMKFFGRVFEDIDVFFAAADYFVLPGLGGLALNQALFWGLPCIVSEADGTEDDLVLENKTGFRFIPNDGNSLKNALQKCLALSNEQREKIGTFGRRLILERSNVNEMVKIFLTTIKKLAL